MRLTKWVRMPGQNETLHLSGDEQETWCSPRRPGAWAPSTRVAYCRSTTRGILRLRESTAGKTDSMNSGGRMFSMVGCGTCCFPPLRGQFIPSQAHGMSSAVTPCPNNLEFCVRLVHGRRETGESGGAAVPRTRGEKRSCRGWVGRAPGIIHGF